MTRSASCKSGGLWAAVGVCSETRERWSEGGAEVVSGEFGGNMVHAEATDAVPIAADWSELEVPVVVFGEAPPFVISEPHAGVGRGMKDHLDRFIRLNGV